MLARPSVRTRLMMPLKPSLHMLAVGYCCRRLKALLYSDSGIHLLVSKMFQLVAFPSSGIVEVVDDFISPFAIRMPVPEEAIPALSRLACPGSVRMRRIDYV